MIPLLLAASSTPSVHAESYWQKQANKLLDTRQHKPGKLTSDEIGRAFKQALNLGADQVVARLGKTDGFNTDSVIRILLPDDLQKARKLLKKVGQQQYADELELRLNRAAELATPKARELFVQAIQSMTFSDIMTIYNGPDDSATRYFEQAMSAQLAAAMRPIVDDSLAQVKAVESYEKLAKRYNKLPFTRKLEADLGGHVVSRGMSGIFHYLAKEEAAIRQQPRRHTTELLRKVFGRLQ